MEDEFSFMGLLEIPNVSRINYGNDNQNKPNNFCYWDDDITLWVEDDEHLRDRIKKSLR